MTQRNVEHLLGRLVLDEDLRERFRSDRRALLVELLREGLDLTAVELDALAALEPRDVERFTGAVDGRLQRASLVRNEAPRPASRRRKAPETTR